VSDWKQIRFFWALELMIGLARLDPLNQAPEQDEDTNPPTLCS